MGGGNSISNSLIESKVTLEGNKDSNDNVIIDNKLDWLRYKILNHANIKLKELKDDDVLAKSKIDSIISTSFKENDSDAILALFDEIDNIDTIKRYEETKKLKESAKKIIEEFDYENIDKDILYNVREDFEREYENIESYYMLFKYKFGYALGYDEIYEIYMELTTFINKIINKYNEIYNSSYNRDRQIKLVAQILKPKTPKELKSHKISTGLKDKIIKEMPQSFESTTQALPRIISYNNALYFKNKDLITNIDSIESNLFFIALMKAAKVTSQSIKQAYDKEKNAAGYLSRKADDFNEKNKKLVQKRFNELFCKVSKDAQHYEFEVLLEHGRIAFSMYRNGKQDVLELDLQSDGFKWFFNLFFGLIHGKGLQNGDIVLMDEPAHNLSVPARKEFRDFLKKYGEESGVTFVVITHDPFLAHIDHLDELRIVQNVSSVESKTDSIESKRYGIEIINDFSSIESSDTDALLRIKRAFGVGENVLFSPEIRIIFVEGITDYNYLSAFKLLQGRENNDKCVNVAFVPIGGLGESGKRKEILKGLMKLSKEPILLVDDDKAGDEIKKAKNELKADKLRIIKLSEIDSKFKDIESCFDKIDAQRYGILKNDGKPPKSSKLSQAFKREVLWHNGKVESSSKENFYKILKYLDEL